MAVNARGTWLKGGRERPTLWRVNCFYPTLLTYQHKRGENLTAIAANHIWNSLRPAIAGAGLDVTATRFSYGSRLTASQRNDPGSGESWFDVPKHLHVVRESLGDSDVNSLDMVKQGGASPTHLAGAR